jgi:hypothetical protein
MPHVGKHERVGMYHHDPEGLTGLRGGQGLNLSNSVVLTAGIAITRKVSGALAITGIHGSCRL